MRKLAVILSLMLLRLPVVAQQVRIGVLGLFHPRHLVVSAPLGTAFVVEASEQSFTIENGSDESGLDIQSEAGDLVLRYGSHLLRSRAAIGIRSREGGPVDMLVTVPGKLTRHYRGRLEVSQNFGILIAIVSMDLETAVASVVAAESPAAEPLEALKAQAVAARSYFIAAGRRHLDFDFCDTTHCQFLRQPPAPEESAWKAANSTRGLVVAYRFRTVATMYTRSCSGWTRTPTDVGLPTDVYPYYSVECTYCRRHPPRWHSSVAAEDAASLHGSDERSRLALNRRLGWNTVESNDFTVRRQDTQMVLDGVGQGHGIGLCQAGGWAMAEEGADFRQILAHYYPNTDIIRIDEHASNLSRHESPQ